jgi:hypothetical protein
MFKFVTKNSYFKSLNECEAHTVFGSLNTGMVGQIPTSGSFPCGCTSSAMHIDTLQLAHSSSREFHRLAISF